MLRIAPESSGQLAGKVSQAQRLSGALKEATDLRWGWDEDLWSQASGRTSLSVLWPGGWASSGPGTVGTLCTGPPPHPLTHPSVHPTPVPPSLLLSIHWPSSRPSSPTQQPNHPGAVPALLNSTSRASGLEATSRDSIRPMDTWNSFQFKV